MMTPIVPRKEVLKQKLFQIFNKYDVEGLIAIGAPKDEYSPEVNEILKLSRNRIKYITPKLVKNVWDKMFDLGTSHMTVEIATKIVEELKKK